MYCTHCGAPTREGDLFCTRCGAKIPVANAQDAAVSSGERPKIDPKPDLDLDAENATPTPFDAPPNFNDFVAPSPRQLPKEESLPEETSPHASYATVAPHAQRPDATATTRPAPDAKANRSAAPSLAFALAINVGSILCCCMPLGLVGVVFSIQAFSARDRGDLAATRRAAERADFCAWCSATFVASVAVVVCFAAILSSFFDAILQ